MAAPGLYSSARVAKVGSLSARAKMATKIFVKRIFTIFTTIANLTQYNMQYVPCNSSLLAQETLFLTKKKNTFFGKRFPKSV